MSLLLLLATPTYKVVSDTAAGVGTSSLAVSISSSDSGSGTESYNKKFGSEDTGSGSEASTLVASASSREFGTDKVYHTNTGIADWRQQVGLFNLGSGIAVSDDYVYIVNDVSGSIDLYDHSGNHIRTIGQGTPGGIFLADPYNVAINPVNGDLLVNDHGNSLIRVYNADGTSFIRTIGSAGTFPANVGTLYQPTTIASDSDGNIYILDVGKDYTGSANSRIQKWTSGGTFKGIWKAGIGGWFDVCPLTNKVFIESLANPAIIERYSTDKPDTIETSWTETQRQRGFQTDRSAPGRIYLVFVGTAQGDGSINGVYVRDFNGTFIDSFATTYGTTGANDEYARIVNVITNGDRVYVQDYNNKNYQVRYIFDTELSTLHAALSNTDTGSDSEASSLVVSITASDSGTGSDAQALTVPASGSDTGTDTEASILTASITDTDTGVGAESSNLIVGDASVNDSDTGSGAQTSSLSTILDNQESGSDTEAEVLSTLLSDSDTGSGADSDVSITLASSDTSSATETTALAATSSSTDTSQSSDAFTLTASYTQTDNASGTDSGSVTASTIEKTDTDTGTSTEAIQLTVIISDTDSATGIDIGTVGTPITSTDSGSTSETFILAASIAITESVAPTESYTSLVSILASESISPTDTSTLFASFTNEDLSNTFDVFDLHVSYTNSDSLVGVDIEQTPAVYILLSELVSSSEDSALSVALLSNEYVVTTETWRRFLGLHFAVDHYVAYRNWIETDASSRWENVPYTLNGSKANTRWERVIPYKRIVRKR